MSKVKFNDGIPERDTIYDKKYSKEELSKKTCGGCVRCEKRDIPGTVGWHCCSKPYEYDISPNDIACKEYWDKAGQEELDRLHNEDIEKRRKELWSIYASKDPVKLHIINDGYGYIPECPICGEMPYSTKQCHWCGQRFIQDDCVKAYNKPATENMPCPNCGKSIKVIMSKYNGHRSGHCDQCGCNFIE